MDPLALVFVPGAAAIIAAAAAPLVYALRAGYRWRGRRRNRSGCCSRCGRPWAHVSAGLEFFLAEGLFVCPRCATTLRRRLWVLLPGTAMLGVIAVVGSGAGALLGGGSLDWWLGWRLLPLLLPAAGLIGGLVGGVALMKRANRLAGGVAADPILPSGDHTRPQYVTPGS